MTESKTGFRFWWFFLSLKGRLQRVPFIAFMLPMKLVSLAVMFIQYNGLTLTPPVTLGLLIFQLAFAWPQYAVTIKRLHDVGRSALFALHIPLYMAVWLGYMALFYLGSGALSLNLLPSLIHNYVRDICLFYGFALSLILAIIPGNKGLNRYSPRDGTDASAVF